MSQSKLICILQCKKNFHLAILHGPKSQLIKCTASEFGDSESKATVILLIIVHNLPS